MSCSVFCQGPLCLVVSFVRVPCVLQCLLSGSVVSCSEGPLCVVVLFVRVSCLLEADRQNTYIHVHVNHSGIHICMPTPMHALFLCWLVA